MKRGFVVVLVLAVATIALTGCIGNDAQADEVRDAFVDRAENVSSYGYESELTRELTAVNQRGRQVSTTTTDAIIDYEDRELRSYLVSVRQQANETRSNTTTYLTNGTVYERTESSLGDSGWTRFENTQEVESTWEARDELGLYTDLLENASVSMADMNEEAPAGMHILDVELGEEKRIEFLTGKLGDDAAFFENIEINEFSMRVWISEDHRLVRTESEISMVAPDQQTGAGVVDLEVNAEFTDEFSYDRPVEVELPEKARNAELLRPEAGLGAGGNQQG